MQQRHMKEIESFLLFVALPKAARASNLTMQQKTEMILSLSCCWRYRTKLHQWKHGLKRALASNPFPFRFRWRFCQKCGNFAIYLRFQIARLPNELIGWENELTLLVAEHGWPLNGGVPPLHEGHQLLEEVRLVLGVLLPSTLSNFLPPSTTPRRTKLDRLTLASFFRLVQLRQGYYRKMPHLGRLWLYSQI
jgi:hypothetical protein